MLNWLDRRITQWQLWFFRTFRMRGNPRPPDEWIDHIIKEQEERKQEEKRQSQRRDERQQDERKAERRGLRPEELVV
jgi:hypothetical protein